MYITYVTNPICKDGRHKGLDPQQPRKFPTPPKPNFMPSRLVRISDMQVVQGSEVDEGYFALSYSWNWSGDIIVDEDSGKTRRDDQGKHQIIFSTTIPDGQIASSDSDHGDKATHSVKFVKFEGIIQQICNDFNIKYIWFDQMCINQENKAEKLQEIHNMYKIYGNAHCTVALVPEYYLAKSGLPYEKAILASEWFKRLWTLEEALMSKKLLFIGRDVHSWSDDLRSIYGLRVLCEKPRDWKVSSVLWYAHTRTSTKEHDRVFALANVFPDIMHDLTISYDEPAEDLLIRFYGLLATKDLSILCFKHKSTPYSRETATYFYQKQQIKSLSATIVEKIDSDDPATRKYNLPSWTGIAGEHTLAFSDDPEGYLETTFRNYSISGRFMHLRCSSIVSINQSFGNANAFVLRSEDLPPLPASANPKNFNQWNLSVRIQLPGHSDKKTILYGQCPGDPNGPSSYNVMQLRRLSYFTAIQKEDLAWVNLKSTPEKKHTFIFFSLTEGDDVERFYSSTQYVILSGVAFNLQKMYERRKTYPVIRTDGDHNKVIGTCEIYDADYFFSGYTEQPEQAFIIQ